MVEIHFLGKFEDGKVFADALRYSFRFQDRRWIPVYIEAMTRDAGARQSAVYALSRLDPERLAKDELDPLEILSEEEYREQEG